MVQTNKTYWSNWHITVNCNRHEKSKSSRIATVRKLADAVNRACTEAEYLWRWLRYYRNGQQVEMPNRQKRRVERIRSRVSLEVGPQAGNRSVHAHILLEVQHRTRVQIDEQEFRNVLEEVLGWDGLNVKSRFVRGNGEDKEYLLRYLQKDGVPSRAARGEENRRIQQSEEVMSDENYL